MEQNELPPVSSSTPIDYSQPVAYGPQGQPLYAHPAPTVPIVEPQAPQPAGPTPPETAGLSPEDKVKHEQSLRDFPDLNLSSEEFVISSVNRHSIGLLGPVSLTVILVILILAFIGNYPLIQKFDTVTPLPNANLVMLIGGLISLLILGGGFIAMWVYRGNKLFVTNESLIQYSQSGLFDHDEQTVSLGSIEDASFHQDGFLQTMFGYGTIHISTPNDETNYELNYVIHPKAQVKLITNAVEDFKRNYSSE